MSRRLIEVEMDFCRGNDQNLRKGVRGLAAVADQIGLELVVRISQDVIYTLDHADPIALTATLSRLLRIGEHSLLKVSQIRGLSN